MKDSNNSANLLDLPYSAEAEQYLDELERSGQFRIGIDAEHDDSEAVESASNDYSWGCGSGNVSIHDWWRTGRVTLRVGPGIGADGVALMRVDDSLLVRTADGFDSVTLESYLGLIPDAATLRIVFHDGEEWAGDALTSRIADWQIADAPRIRSAS